MLLNQRARVASSANGNTLPWRSVKVMRSITPSRILLAAALAALLLLPPAVPVAAQAPAVQVVPEPGVAPEAILDVQHGVELSLQFFKSAYGLDLTRQVRIIIVPDRASYAAAMIREFRISEAEADRRTRTTSAWTAGPIIIMTVTPSSARASRIFLIAHELMHQFQMQVTAPVTPWRLYWMSEGVADAVAARTVESAGYAAAGSYQARWLGTLRRASVRPELPGLGTMEGWFAWLDRSGSSATYALAGLAALYLADRAGHGAILAYFRALSGGNDAPTAFQQAFSRPLEVFLEELRRFLGDQLGERTNRSGMFQTLHRRDHQLLIPVA